LTPDLTIKSLINKAGGVQDEAFLNVATIQRQKKNENPEMISFNLGKILAGEDSDIALINGDFIVIDSLQNFMDEQFVTIQGKVKKTRQISTKYENECQRFGLSGKGIY